MSCPDTGPVSAGDDGAKDRLRGLDPTTPLLLVAVASGQPKSVAELVGAEHHGVEASRAKRCQSSFGGNEQGSPDAVATMLRTNGQAVQVGSPAVPASNDRPDQFIVAHSHEQRVRVTLEQRDHCSPAVSRPAVVLRGSPSQIKHRVDVVQACRTNSEVVHELIMLGGAVPAGEGPPDAHGGRAAPP